MNNFDHVEVLLVEDDEQHAGLTMRALAKGNINNNLLWVRDGGEALDFVNATGAFEGRDKRELPR